MKLTSFKYDSANRLIEKQEFYPDGTEIMLTKYYYGKNSLISEEAVYFNGEVSYRKKYIYDAERRLVEENSFARESQEPESKKVLKYDSHGNCIEEINYCDYRKEAESTVYEYDSLGNCIKKVDHFYITFKTYDLNNNCIAEKEFWAESNELSESRIWKYNRQNQCKMMRSYDENGNLTSIHVTNYNHDGKIIDSSGYSPYKIGMQYITVINDEFIEINSNGKRLKLWKYSENICHYDINGNCIEESRIYDHTLGNENLVIIREFDINGNCVKYADIDKKDNSLLERHYKFDQESNCLEEKEYKSNGWNFFGVYYDSLGHRIN